MQWPVQVTPSCPFKDQSKLNPCVLAGILNDLLAVSKVTVAPLTPLMFETTMFWWVTPEMATSKKSLRLTCAESVQASAFCSKASGVVGLAVAAFSTVIRLFEKASLPMVGVPSTTTLGIKLALNALAPILVTLLGIVCAFKITLASNASWPIVFSPFPNVKLLIEL